MTNPLSRRDRRDVPLVVGAVALSALGDFLAVIPLALHIQSRTGSGLAVAALFIALWTPLVVLAGPAGLLVDRWDARRLLVAASVLQAALAVALAFSAALGPILLLAALMGTAGAVGQPAEFALLPAVAGPERLARVNGHVEAARYLGFTAGPLAGAALAAAGSTRVALLADAASFGVVALAGTLLRARRAAPPVGDRRRRRARDGIVFLTRDRVLALVLGVAFVSLLFMTASASAEVFFATDVLHAGPFGYGLIMTAWAVGMTAGALALAPRVTVPALGGAALAGICVQSLGLALPTLWLSLAFTLGAYALGGAAHGTKNVVLRTLIHTRVPADLHGRAFAAYNGLRNGAELGALAMGGLLIAAIGARWTLCIAGAAPFLAGLAGVAIHRARARAATVTPLSITPQEATP